MPKFKYFKVYKNMDYLRADRAHLKEVLPESVTGGFFKDIPVLDLQSDQEIDFESYGSSGWQIDPEEE